MFCGGCGTTVNEGARFCQKCGRPVATAPPSPPPAYVPPQPPAPPAYTPPVAAPPPPPPPVIPAPPAPPAFTPPAAAPPPPPPAPPVYSAPLAVVAAPPPPPPPVYAAQPVAAPPPPAYAPPPGPVAPVYATPQTGMPSYAGPQFAGFWLRFVAYLIDGLIYGIPLGVICVLLFLLFGGVAAIHNVAMTSNPDPEMALAQAQSMVGALLGFYFMFFLVA